MHRSIIVWFLLAQFALAMLPMAVNLSQPPSDTWLVRTVAGYGVPDVGDNGTAIGALLHQPSYVVARPDGIYIADGGQHRIRRVRPDGVIQTVAGNGTSDNRQIGDGLPATQAQLRFPGRIDFGPDGTLYIADTRNYRVRKITADGIIRTIAGTGGLSTPGGYGQPATQVDMAPSAVALDSFGNIYIGDSDGNRVLKLTLDGTIHLVAGTGEHRNFGDGGPAIAADLRAVSDLAVDNIRNWLYIGVWGGQIRRVNLNTGIIDSVPNALCYCWLGLDAERNLLFSNYRVQKYNAGTGQITEVAGNRTGFAGDGGPATQAALFSPSGLSVDSQGNIYIADRDNARIRRVRTDGIIETFAGGGIAIKNGIPALQASVYDGQGIAVDRFGNVFFSDLDHTVIRKLDRNGIVTTVAGTGLGFGGNNGDGGHPLQAIVGGGLSLTFDSHGNLLFVDQTPPSTVRSISPGADGAINGSPDERVITIAGQLKGSQGEFADHGSADGKPAREAIFFAVRGIAVDSKDNLYIGDWLDNRARKVVPGSDGALNGGSDEIITTVAGNGTLGSSGDGGLATQASVGGPGVGVDRQDNLYVGDYTGRIRRVDLNTGIITAYARVDDVGGAGRLLFDSNGNLYFGNGISGSKIFRLDPISKIKTVIAGTDERGFAGDGGDAKQAQFQSTAFITFSPEGDIYLMDNGNFRIRQLTARGFCTSCGNKSATTVSAASYKTPLAPDSIATAFGSDLALTTSSASALPLPAQLAGTTVNIKDTLGKVRSAPIFFVSPAQVNFHIPFGTVTGPAMVSIWNSNGIFSMGEVQIDTVAPAVFSASSTGSGVAAAVVARYRGNTFVGYEPVAIFDNAQNRWLSLPIDLGPESDQIYLLLFGSGIRFRNSLEAVVVKIGGIGMQVSYAGEAQGFVGLDQVNVGPLPRSLAGRGEMDVILTADSKAANTVRIAIK
ncbi:MAG: hypothetical protein ACREEM_00795 [Blastocatellia bacterium]